MNHSRKFAKRFFLLVIAPVLFFAQSVACAAECSSSATLLNIPLKFYSHSIGTYTIFLTDTLTAIANGQADQNGYQKPYYEKNWTGDCPGGLSGDDCIEYTVYPDATNYSPGDIMEAIEKYNHGDPDRGEVRIITDNAESNYVYTTDHESAFCGPYAISQRHKGGV